MHYYNFNLSDYITATAHLSPMEDLAYRRLIDLYYEKEQPIPNETDWVTRRIRLPGEEEAIKTVLGEFFTLSDANTWVHDVCDKNIAAYQKKCKVNKVNASKGGRPKGSQSKPSRLPDVSLTNNQEPITNNHKDQIPTSVPSVPTCPHTKIIEIYHEVLPELPRVILERYGGSIREKNLRARWKEDKVHHSLEFWRAFFETVKKNKFWLGENDRGWKADFEWLTRRNNFDKVIQRGMG